MGLQAVTTPDTPGDGAAGGHPPPTHPGMGLQVVTTPLHTWGWGCRGSPAQTHLGMGLQVVTPLKTPLRQRAEHAQADPRRCGQTMVELGSQVIISQSNQRLILSCIIHPVCPSIHHSPTCLSVHLSTY